MYIVLLLLSCGLASPFSSFDFFLHGSAAVCFILNFKALRYDYI